MDEITRREFASVTAATMAFPATLLEAAPGVSSGIVQCRLTINGKSQDIECDPRVTLLDLLRERLHLTGTKKGCDHGQCGACTVLVDGIRMNSCLLLAVTRDGSQITTIEGIAEGEKLHPVQAAFLERDAFQCGFCTSGQICSAAAMLKEWHSGMRSSVTPVDASGAPHELTDAEIRERMSGNLCRCGAYPNIVEAIHDARREMNEG